MRSWLKTQRWRGRGVHLFLNWQLMRPTALIAAAAVLFNVLCSHAHPSAADCKEEWFEQRVDHFSSKLPFGGSYTWRQRFLTNDRHHNPDNGSIFFYTGNEGDVTLYANNTGLMVRECQCERRFVTRDCDAFLSFSGRTPSDSARCSSSPSIATTARAGRWATRR